MPNKEQNALLVHRENYSVPKGQERSVHVRIAKVDSKGAFLEKPRIIHEEPKAFDTMIKRNLEILGYTVEILFHPEGKYTDVKIEDKDAVLKAKDAEIAELKAKVQEGAGDALKAKDDEIAKLKAELAKAKADKTKAKEEKAKEEKAKGGKKSETAEKKEA